MMSRLPSILFAAVLLSGTAALHAQTSVTVPFNSLSDLSLFSYPNTSPDAGTSSLGYASTSGTGGSGAGVFQSTGGLNVDKHVVAYYNGLSLSAPSTTSFTMSIMVMFPDLSTTSGENDGEVRFGFFAADPATGLPSPGTAGSPSTFSTANPSFYVKAKFDITAPGTAPVLSIEPQMTTAYNSTKSVAVTGTTKLKTTQFSLFDYYKFTLTMDRKPDGTYAGTSAIYDMGPNGTDQGTLLSLDAGGTSSEAFTAAANSVFASSANVYAGLIFGGETAYNWSGNQYHIYADNFAFTATVPEPAAAGLLALGAGLAGARRRRRA